MNKGIELTPTQIKAYENGATMFLFGVIEELNNIVKTNDKEKLLSCFVIEKGDKDIFIQEEFYIDNTGLVNYRDDFNFNANLTYHKSRMTKEQSRYSFSECIDVKVVRVKDIELEDWLKIGVNCPAETECMRCYNQQLKEQNINRTYEDNDYVFLVEFKK